MSAVRTPRSRTCWLAASIGVGAKADLGFDPSVLIA